MEELGPGHADGHYLQLLTFILVTLAVAFLVRWLKPHGRRLSEITRRLIAAVGLAVALFCQANEWFGLGLFPGFERRATGAAFVVLLLLLYVTWVDHDKQQSIE